MNFKEIITPYRETLSQVRRDLHRIPEVGFSEEKTAQYVAGFLKDAGIEVETGIARYGVVGHINGAAPGETLLLRSDMDGLPILEETGLPFASTHEGVMHACGHDGHMSMVLVTARILKGLAPRLKGHVKVVFQPAEEGPGGALPMIEEGVMENPRVDYSLGCHVWPHIPEGTIGVKPGPLMAAMDRFDLTIVGRAGHGAMPHLCVDAIDVATQVINALQRVASRQTNPTCPVVLTVASFHAGSAFNVIPNEAVLSGTTRTFDREIWQRFPEQMERIVRGVCDSMGASYELNYQKGFPPLINDEGMAERVRRSAETVVGEDRVMVPEPTMGGEDMAFFLERSKGCFFFLGVGREGSPSLHDGRFDFNEDVLPLGVETYCRVIWELLGT
ncbi:MAG: M20 family metallopeptidase [Deltaproteobacteria bacterium]|nr:M20 family metallopeptidase [Deltaproteobacteria bacterium]